MIADLDEETILKVNLRVHEIQKGIQVPKDKEPNPPRKVEQSRDPLKEKKRQQNQLPLSLEETVRKRVREEKVK